MTTQKHTTEQDNTYYRSRDIGTGPVNDYTYWQNYENPTSQTEHISTRVAESVLENDNKNNEGQKLVYSANRASDWGIFLQEWEFKKYNDKYYIIGKREDDGCDWETSYVKYVRFHYGLMYIRTVSGGKYVLHSKEGGGIEPSIRLYL
jgi:hypothetical protein